MKRTQRAAELVAEAIRLARNKEPRAEITGSRWQASTRSQELERSAPVSSPAPMAASLSRRSHNTTRHIRTARTETAPALNRANQYRNASPAEKTSGGALSSYIKFLLINLGAAVVVYKILVIPKKPDGIDIVV